jgi:hypothetical protein
MSYRCSFLDIQGSKRPNTINFLFQNQLGTGISQANGELSQVLRRVKPPTCMTVVNSSVILTNEKRNKNCPGKMPVPSQQCVVFQLFR